MAKEPLIPTKEKYFVAGVGNIIICDATGGRATYGPCWAEIPGRAGAYAPKSRDVSEVKSKLESLSRDRNLE